MQVDDQLLPKVFTEGKTDWKHIKRANEHLRICPVLEFHETEDSVGDQNLLKMCESFARVKQSSPHIFIFDNDNKDILKKTTTPQAYYKDWGNNVYSLTLPLPPFRGGFESICVELLYKDEDLMISSPDNRRLFLSSEFDERSGNHKKVPLIHVGNVQRIRGATKRSSTIIVDSEVGVYDSENNNLALSKSDFAEFILKKVGPFESVDFRGFRTLLSIVKSIIDKSKATSLEVLTPEGGNRGNKVIMVRELSSLRKDHPPHTPMFVGRNAHIKKLDDPNIRVAAITGLGGEGKSSIASFFFRMAEETKTNVRFEKLGWCDCKELETTFHERLLVLLEELTDGKETLQKYSDENVRDTIARLIEHLHEQECLLVFDNVDAFVDKDSFAFIDSVRFLFDKITEKLTRSLVVFTCRPPIHDYHPSFLEISADGLSFAECRDLASQFNIQIHENLLRGIYDITKGHALWLNLIFGQIRSGRISQDKIHNVITSNSQITIDLDVKLLRSIWNTLDQREKEIIWVISTFSRPKPLEYIERASGISYQKCVKILRALVSLRLIVEIDSEGITLFDLHPIIRSKAREECGRAKFRSLSARVITILVPSGTPGLAILIKTNELSKATVENYIESVEIAIEAGDISTSIKYLKELSDNLWKIGEETKFVDLSRRLLSAIDDSRFKVGIDTDLTDVFESLINILLTQGEHEVADRYLTKLQDSIESLKQFIFYIEIKGYFLWFKNDFQKAVTLLRDGIEEIRKKKEEVTPDIRYNLALALRDSGKVDDAINIFLKGNDLNTIEKWDINSKDASSSDLGNLGRCFFLKNDLDKGLRLIEMSLAILEKGESRTDKVNQGYAHLWLADIYIAKGMDEEAFLHLSKAIKIWIEFAPARLKKILAHIQNYPKSFRKKYRNKEMMQLIERPHRSEFKSMLDRIVLRLRFWELFLQLYRY